MPPPKVTCRGSPAARSSSVEGLPLHQLHAQEVDSVRLLHRIEGDDVGMLEGGQSAVSAPGPNQIRAARYASIAVLSQRLQSGLKAPVVSTSSLNPNM